MRRAFFALDDTNLDAARELQDHGRLAKMEPDVIYVTSLGREAMRLYRVLHAL